MVCSVGFELCAPTAATAFDDDDDDDDVDTAAMERPLADLATTTDWQRPAEPLATHDFD
jgi:hypothetical protein